MAPSKGCNPKLQGNIGQYAIALKLKQSGYSVFTEWGDSSRVDIIAEKENKLFRIQCKTSYPKNGAISLHLKKTSCNGYVYFYKKEDFDFFALYDMSTGEIAFVSSDILNTNTSHLHLRIDKPKNNQIKNVKWFKDYTDISILS